MNILRQEKKEAVIAALVEGSSISVNRENDRGSSRYHYAPHVPCRGKLCKPYGFLYEKPEMRNHSG